MSDHEYRVEQPTTVVIDDADLGGHRSVPCWDVYHYNRSGSAWQIGKYDSEEVALKVAEFLSEIAPHALP